MKVIGVEDGYTVVEMLTVMVILGVVMGGIIAMLGVWFLYRAIGA